MRYDVMMTMKSAVLSALWFVLIAPPVSGQEPQLRTITIEQPRTIDGIPCGPTGKAKARLYSSGKLESCPLAVDHVLHGHTLKAKTWVYIDKFGTLTHAWLAQNTKIQGHTCKGTGYDGWVTEFYPTGRLKLCYLAEEELIQGVPCRKGSFWGEVTGGVKVSFYENGNLESCRAARDFSRAGRDYKKRRRVYLDPNGQPISAPAEKPRTRSRD